MEVSLRTLLVEDNPDDAALLLRELKKSGYDVHSARVDTPAEFSAALMRETWDVVLSDFSMPGFSGLAALEILKASNLDLPFIIVSGTLGEAVAVEVMRAGAHDYFAKGHLVRLAAAIDREVRECAQRRERTAEKRRAEEERERLLDRLREAVAVRDTFLSIASHELRTPITALQLQIQGLQRISARGELSAILPATFDAKLGTIGRQVTRLTTLISSLLDVTRITSGDVSLSRERVELAELVTEELAALEPVRRQTTSEIHVSGGPVVGDWDRLRIQTAIGSLLSNAIKFGEGKPIEVTIGTEGGVACIAVRDHGLAFRPKLSSAFSRSSSARSRVNITEASASACGSRSSSSLPTAARSASRVSPTARASRSSCRSPNRADERRPANRLTARRGVRFGHASLGPEPRFKQRVAGMDNARAWLP